MNITRLTGGVCAPQGFQAAGIRCGIAKAEGKRDLALIYSKVPCNAAGVYTTNKVQAAPIRVTKANLENGKAQAVLCNSGNANACNANGDEVAQKMCALTARALNLSENDIVVASTGVIGQPLPVEKIEAAIPSLASELSANGSNDCALAMMTTDLMEKEIAISFEIGEKLCHIGGVAKGSGMIHPNMATMLAFLTTDVDISSEMLQKALSLIVPDTFNMVSVDGDTSTNDMMVLLANGLAANPAITQEGPEFSLFCKALLHVCIYLSRLMAKDGEGATKLLECVVSGAADDATAKCISKSVICSSLFKSAMFGADANWGRVLCAMGYAGVEFDVSKVEVSFQSKSGWIQVCKNGAGVAFSEKLAKQVLGENEIEILIHLHQGQGKAVAWGCDLTYDYVKINGDYRS